jgi:hypothetical protein
MRAGILTLIASAALIGAGGAAAAQASCGGRTSLSCQAKHQIEEDLANSGALSVGEAELFELRLPLPLGNPDVRRFWSFEQSHALARAFLEDELVNQIPNSVGFQQVIPPVGRIRVTMRRRGVITRRIARAMGAAMTAEQVEFKNLEGMLLSLDSATSASLVENRSDWVAYQEQVAAGFARHAAAVIPALIRDRRRLTRLLLAKRLRFGVGPVDLEKTRRQVSRHGLAPAIKSGLEGLGFDAATTNELEQFGVKAIKGATSPGSYVLSSSISDSSTVSALRALRSGLEHYAATAPHGLPEPA